MTPSNPDGVFFKIAPHAAGIMPFHKQARIHNISGHMNFEGKWRYLNSCLSLVFVDKHKVLP